MLGNRQRLTPRLVSIFDSRWITALFVCAVTLLSTACSSIPPADPTATDEWHEWQAKRLNSMAGTNGWTTLVGLLWVNEGTNTLGSDPASDLKLPEGRAPKTAGLVIRTGTQARFIPAPGVTATLDGAPVTDAMLRSDGDGAEPEPAVLALGPLRIITLQRSERMALRVKDPEAPTRRHFVGLDYYPYDPHWRIEGRFEPAAAYHTLKVTDVTGRVKAEPSPGTIVFTVAGQEQRLDVLDDDETYDLWAVFRDQTAGKTTYGGGRFLHVALPGPDNRVVIDFNYAYSPPCAFTSFATCPLPPRQNWLRIPVPAGELKYRGGHE